jgi:hypothetical protein
MAQSTYVYMAMANDGTPLLVFTSKSKLVLHLAREGSVRGARYWRVREGRNPTRELITGEIERAVAAADVEDF